MKGLEGNSLLMQTILLMTLALFPLGVVAIYQTNRVAAQAERNADLALLAMTGRAAKAEELLVERGFGVAQFFGAIAGDFMNNAPSCTARLGPFVTRNDSYSFIGILPPSGRMTCSSSGVDYDFSDWERFDDIMISQERIIVVNKEAPLSRASVFIVNEPFEIDGQFAGFISVSIPHDGLPGNSEELSKLGLEELITFNPDGDILTARTDLVGAELELPSDLTLASLSGSVTKAFQAKNQDGVLRTYTVVPIEGSPASIMGVWRISDGLANRVAAYVQPALFPILMWIASMSVATLSIYTLVLRHIGRMRTDMDAFAKNRTITSTIPVRAMPTEFQSLNANFMRMAEGIMHDEAKLEDTSREKSVLIKEVHHRVKNNLQLISSIMNMQIREAEHDETKSVLSRLQDRIISLATIHRDLYQSQNAGMVNAGGLVSDIVEKTLEVAIKNSGDIDVKTDIDAVLLFPDQAVPLSLLMAEAMTNAMKYLGAAEGKKPWLTIALKQEGERCSLSLANSTGNIAEPESTGLGAQLITAFGIQLGGKIEIAETTDSYTMHISFRIEDFMPDTPNF